jgi:hypothetical protein
MSGIDPMANHDDPLGDMPARPRLCVIVAGMHRSGTSAAARVVNLLRADIRLLQRDLRQSGAKTAKLEPVLVRQAAELRAIRRSVTGRITNRCDGSTCLG